MSETQRISRRTLALVAVISSLLCVALTLLLINIAERKQEARAPGLRLVALDDTVESAAEWGKNFPLQYDDYRKTTDMEQTLYGGSEAVPSVGASGDPRDVVSRSKLETIPQLTRMWAGYAFALDFREERGHAYMLADQLYTRRLEVGQPGACFNCHASTHVAMKQLGDGDLHVGFEQLNKMPYAEARVHLSSPVSCIDCHEPESMALRVTRPAFMEGIAAVKRLEGITGYDVNADATRQEMRTYVCAQCHVEYYFRGESKLLTYPWERGLRVEDALAYYDERGVQDWTHKETGAPMLKAQHPEFELWSQGIHARSGVSCADCHMPYKRVGGMKISDHHVRSPLLAPNNACGTCHKLPDRELVARVESIQTRHRDLADLALGALVDLIDDINAGAAAGLDPAKLDEARQYQRRASFYVDYAEAENSSGFHAPQEAARILANSIEFSRRGQAALD